MLALRTTAILLLMILPLPGCSSDQESRDLTDRKMMEASNQPLQVGGIYATPDEDGSWRVVRVLALDEHAVHLRSYTDRFSEPPKDVALPKLNWFVGHMPLDRDGFESEPRVLVKVVPVEEDELEGYRYYLDAMNGGVDGS